MSVRIHGAGGRLGREVARQAERAGLVQDDGAPVHLIAVPWRVAGERIDTLPAGDTVIDLSGVLKHRRQGRYGLLVGGDRLVDGGRPRRGDRLANPGCMAGAVILGLHQTGLTEHILGPVQVTVVGGRAMASRGATGVLRPGRKWRDHPHVREIEGATGLTIASFVPTVAFGHGRGLLAIVTGTLGEGAPPARPAEVDVSAVLDTEDLALRWDQHGRDFTLAVAADNLSLPAAHAVRLAMAVQA
jgi:N-acetyl-gamma-glutamylphosphate reductase